MAIRPKEIYRGKRPWRTVIAVVLSILAVLLIAAVVLFYALQKYVVVTPDGISLEVPFLSTASPASETEAPTASLAPVELIIDDPDYSGVETTAGENLTALYGLYISAGSISETGLAAAAETLSAQGGNTLVLEMKDASGALAWASQVDTALSYGTSGSFDIGPSLAALKEQDIYLVAAISCCTDELLATRNPFITLKDAAGNTYSDDQGVWLDPYNQTVRTYILDLMEELIALGFDEILLQNAAHPMTESALTYSQEMTAEPDPVSCVSGLALYLTESLGDTPAKISAQLDTEALRGGLSAQNGQDVSFFLTVFDRVYVETDDANISGDQAAVEAAMTEGDIALRFIPLRPGGAGGTWTVGRQ